MQDTIRGNPTGDFQVYAEAGRAQSIITINDSTTSETMAEHVHLVT